jgi:hypothetical protein
VRAIVGAIPAVIVILVGALVVLPALFLSQERQGYALLVWKGVVELVSVLVGTHGGGPGEPGM